MDPIYLATFAVALFSSLLSGLAGGGGGFIMAPYWLICGLSPAQGATTGAFMALGMGSSSLAAYKGTGQMPKRRRLIVALLVITLITSLIGPFFLQATRPEVFAPLLAVLTIASVPFLFIDRSKLPFSSRPRVGFAVLSILLLASSFITSSAFSIMIAVVLAKSFGLTTLQSTAVRRMIGIVQSLVIFIVLCALRNFVLPHAVAALAGGTIGSYIGTRIGLRRGEAFATYALAIEAVAGAIALLVR